MQEELDGQENYHSTLRGRMQVFPIFVMAKFRSSDTRNFGPIRRIQDVPQAIQRPWRIDAVEVPFSRTSDQGRTRDFTQAYTKDIKRYLRD